MTKGITAMGFSTGMYIQKENQVQIGPREVELYVEAGVTLHMHYRPLILMRMSAVRCKDTSQTSRLPPSLHIYHKIFPTFPFHQI